MGEGELSSNTQKQCWKIRRNKKKEYTNEVKFNNENKQINK